MPKPNALARRARKEAEKGEKKKKSSTGAGGGGWLKKGREEIDSNKSTGGGSFARDFWLNNGENALVRFPYNTVEDMTVSVRIHTYPAKTKTGKRYFRSFTCTEDPSTCAGCANGDKSSQRWPVIVIDKREMEYDVRDKKDPKKSKKVNKTDVAKVFKPSVQELDNLAYALEEYSERAGKPLKSIRKAIFKITRVGEGPKTSYRFSVVKVGQDWTDEETAALEDFEKESGTIEKILAPISKAEQKKIIGIHGSDDDEDDSEDEEDEGDDEDDDDLEDVEDMDDEDDEEGDEDEDDSEDEDDEEEEDEDEE